MLCFSPNFEFGELDMLFLNLKIKVLAACATELQVHDPVRGL